MGSKQGLPGCAEEMTGSKCRDFKLGEMTLCDMPKFPGKKPQNRGNFLLAGGKAPVVG